MKKIITLASALSLVSAAAATAVAAGVAAPAAPAVAAPVTARAAVTRPAAAPATNNYCLQSENKLLCVKAPSSWTAKRSIERGKAGTEFQWQEDVKLKSTWTEFVAMGSYNFSHGDYCDADAKATATVTRVAKTAAVDRKGKRVYAVTYVEHTPGQAKGYAARTMLVTTPATVGQTKPLCTSSGWYTLNPWLQGTNGAEVFAYIPDAKAYATKALAQAAAKGDQHRLGFNVLATAYKGR